MKRSRKTAVVAACFLMVLITLGFCSSNKGLYLSAITQALGLKRSLFSVNDSIRFITSAAVSLFFGTMIRQYGPRKLIAAGFVSLICSVLLYSVSNNIPGFYLGGALLGFGLAWTTTSMVGYLIGKWCPDNRGTIMGFVLAANGIGGAAAAQIVSPIIYQEGNAFGYRSAYRLVALILLLTGILVVSVIREPESAAGTAAPGKKRRGRQWTGISYEEAKKSTYFYIAVASVFLTGMVLQSVNGVGAAHMRDAGLDPAYVANVWSIHSLVLACAKFFTGFLYDKDGFIAVALGSYYGEIGDRYYFTLDSGIVLPLVKGEEKADEDTDYTGCYHTLDGSVIEFVIDDEYAASYFGANGNGYVLDGNYNNYSLFNGSIAKVEKVLDEKVERIVSYQIDVDIPQNVDIFNYASGY